MVRRSPPETSLYGVSEAELIGLARAANSILAGRAHLIEGPMRPHRQPGRGTEFLDFQRYQPGSDLRDIDWRASARHQHKLVRTYHKEMSSEWYVCLDRSASMAAPDPAKWALAVQLAVALTFVLLRRIDRVGILTFSSEIDDVCPPGRGQAQFKRAVAAMSRARCRTSGGRTDLAACAGQIGRRRSVLVISDFLAPDALGSGLVALSRLGGSVHAVQVLSEHECDLPAGDDAMLQDIESGACLSIERRAEAGSAARRSLALLRDDLAAHCRRHGIVYSSCSSAQTWKTAALQHLRQTRRRNA